MFLKLNIKCLILLFVIAFGTFQFNGLIGKSATLFAADESENNGNEADADAWVKRYANYCVAVSLMLDGEWVDAIKFLEKTLEVDPRCDKAHLYISSCYFQLDQRKEAVLHLKEASRIKPDDFNIHYTLGNILQADGDVDGSIREFELAIGCGYMKAYSLLYVDALFNTANMYVDKRDFDKAISCLQEVLDLNLSKEPESIYYEIGKLRYTAGDYNGAVDALERVKELSSSFSRIHIFLTFAYEQLKEYEKAIYEAKTYIRKSPNAWKMHLALNRVYNELGKEEKADEHREKATHILKESIRLNSKDFDGYVAYGRILADQNKPRAALKIVKACLSFAKNDVERKGALFLLANISYSLNQSENVEKYLRMALEIDDNLSPANNFLGYFFAERGVNLDEAIVLIKKALDVEPDNGAYLDSLAWAYYKKAILENHDEMIRLALDILIKADQKIKDPEVQEHMGDIYFGLGEWEKANIWWDGAIKTAEESKKILRNTDKTIKRISEKVEKLKRLIFTEALNNKALSDSAK